MTSLQSQASLPFQADDASQAGHGAHARLFCRCPALPPPLWDEMRDGYGRLRERWRQFADLVPAAADPADDLDRRLALVARQILHDGITHNVFGEQGAAQRPWPLELLPLLIDSADWVRIEHGVVQRAQLLEAMLADLYGPQQLLHEGLLPPALLLRHPGYLRGMHGVRPASGQRLHIVAFDVVRNPQGDWQVIARRCQGPSGLGYVLHNRLVISRQFSEAFRALRVQHIASSYRRLLDSIEAPARAVAQGATPRVVLLTPGPYAQTYFEHAYLARYLGLPLVEGADLTVRDRRLYLKTVEGLEPVHGMLRRLDDDWCDPLELRADSTLGVPGLLQALRAGHLVMANALGSAVLESPGLQGFLPAIAQRLLGQPLLLPSPPTWWCGEASAWHDVRTQLDDKVLRSTYPRAGGATAPRRPAAVAIESDPDDWTAVQRLRYSRAPVWSGGGVQPRPAALRVYAIAEGDGRWHVLPGGMTRVARLDDDSVSMQRGGASLDTWVLTQGVVDRFSMLPRRLSVDDIAARRAPVSSRAAENLFWFGRYTERAEQTVRLARALLTHSEDDSDAPASLRDALSQLAVRFSLAPAGVPTLNQSPQLFERALLGTMADPAGQGVAFNLSALQRTAQGLRERLSTDQWSVLQALAEDFAQALPGGAVPSVSQVLAALQRLTVQLGAVTGAQSDRMTRDHGWRFMTVGRLLERLIGLCTQLDAFVDADALAHGDGMELLLELFDSAITFRARYQRQDDLLGLADLLVLDSANPRALAGVLRRLRTELGKLPGGEPTRQALLGMLPAEGAGLQLGDLRGASEAAIRGELQRVGQNLREAGGALAEAIGHRFFAHAHSDEELQRV